MTKECKFGLRFIQKSIQGAFTWFFSNLGRFTGKRPWVTIGVSLLFVVGFAFGFLRMNDLTESDTMKLYVPQSSRGFDGQDAYDAVFGSSTSDFYLIFQTKDSKEQLFTPENLKEIMNLETAIRETEMSGTKYNDICAKISMGALGERCREISPALYFDYNPNAVDSILQAYGSLENYICKSQLIPSYYMFGSIEDLSDAACSTSQGLTSAKAILVTFSSIGSEDKSDQVHDWQDDVRDLIDNKLASQLKNLKVYYYWGNGVNNEVVRGITDAIPKIAISIAIVIVFLILTMGDFKDSTKSFSLLGVFAVLCTVCGIVLGLGFSLTVGIKWTPTSIIISFLVLGMGVNNAVLLHSTFERQDKSLPVEEQNAAALGEASIFITLTSATTLLSFLMGMNTDFPGIRYFCGSSALVVFACYILVLTLFNGIMIIDWKRSLSNRMDWLCCIVKKPSDNNNNNNQSENKEGWFYHFLDTYVRKLYENRIFQICVVVIFFGIAGFFVYQCTKINVGLNTEDVVPDDSYVLDFSHLKKQHFPTLQPNIHILLPKLDYYKKDVRERIIEMTKKVQQVPGVDKTRSTNIWEMFNAQPGFTEINDEATYKPALAGFLEKAAALSEQLKFDGNGNIEVSDVLLYHTIETEDGGFAVDSMNDVRDTIDSYSDLKAVDYCDEYPIWDSNNAVKKETWINLILSAVAVVIVLLCLLTPWTAIVVLINIALIDICVVGWVPSLNLVLNSVTCCCLVLSVGVAVDYSAHIANRFMLSTGTKSERAGNSIVVMSVNLLSGGIASILGIFMLAFANVPTNRVFFQMMIGVLMFGILYGMVNLPCMFALIGDKSINEKNDSENDKKKKDEIEMIEENRKKSDNNRSSGEIGLMRDSAKVVPVTVEENEKQNQPAAEIVNLPNAVEDHSDDNNKNEEKREEEEVIKENKEPEQQNQQEEVKADDVVDENKEEVKVEENEEKQQQQ